MKDKFYLGLFVLLLGSSTLACVVSSAVETSRMAQEAYFTCVTATPVPTEQIVIGTIVPPTSLPPDVTVTPEYEYGYTTPVPTETPYYRIETFYRNQLVQVGGIEISLTNQGMGQANPEDGTAVYWAEFTLTNHLQDAILVPLSQLTFIRQVVDNDGNTRTGRWTPRTEPVSGLEQTALPSGGTRTYTLEYLIPIGTVNEIALITHWYSNLEGGVPVWFLLGSDDPVNCPHGYASWVDGNPPPPPTPAVIGMGTGGGQGTGICGWPVTGPLVRGFGCSAFPTGIVDPMGCSDPTPYFHNGMDIDVATGTPVVSPINGIATTGSDDVRGLYVRVSSGGESHDLLHLSAQSVSDGQAVIAGQPVGASGSTGNSTGPHLHWTVRQNGSPVDPALWGGCPST